MLEKRARRGFVVTLNLIGDGLEIGFQRVVGRSEHGKAVSREETRIQRVIIVALVSGSGTRKEGKKEGGHMLFDHLEVIGWVDATLVEDIVLVIGEKVGIAVDEQLFRGGGGG